MMRGHFRCGVFSGHFEIDDAGEIQRIVVDQDFGPGREPLVLTWSRDPDPWFTALCRGLEDQFQDELIERRAELARRSVPDAVEHSTYWGPL